jgi:putative endonuclease
VYILECSDNSYYTGVTNNLERRILEHQSGESESSYTFSRRPVKLRWYSEDMDPDQAIELEKQIKGWRKSKKEALINGDWAEIIRLASIRKRK